MKVSIIYFALALMASVTASASEVMHFKYNCIVKELGAGSAALNISTGSVAMVETTTGRENGSTATGRNSLTIGSKTIIGTAGRYSYTERPMRNLFEFIGAPQRVTINLISRSNYTGKSFINIYVNEQKIGGLICIDVP